MLTLFTSPKPFTGDIARLQNNAVTSWLALEPEVQIILIGDEEGMDRAAARLGVEHAPDVGKNSSGTPLVSSVFRVAEERARFPSLCYVNADILLMQDFMAGVRRVASELERYLIVGQRWDVEVEREFSLDEMTQGGIGRRLLENAQPHARSGSDYFVYPRGEFGDMPPFALGRAGWDNWMIYAGRSRGIPVVDASAEIKPLHQNHDYGHLPGGQVHYDLPESRTNVRLAGGREVMFTIDDCSWRLEEDQVRRARWPYPHLSRWLEAALVARLGPGRLSKLVRMTLHPLDALRYYMQRLRQRSTDHSEEGAAHDPAEPHGRIRHPKQERPQ